ncbi:MAG: hypothetical protein NC344_11035 [Bacteroidales bacterium]|nr:hypothetical protein [Bacteroidales bacterium]MCM1148340.1 hypothetical protein [Bacteroidales bacterium]MCM1206967.1 hypothetical protein [Bacillota bacterium]MCM1511263.1 hypothetical protein [Clostridium sp.]
MSEKEREFLETNAVERIYLRMFDVVESLGEAVPNATLRFESPLPKVEIVPTVFITVEALRQAAEAGEIDLLAEKIVKRVTAMCSWHDVPEWKDLQLACDWTGQTREAYFMLCRAVKEKLQGRMLSSTIRLHQLGQEAPPVDYGVLMVYNTDSFADVRTENSILSSTVETWLKRAGKFRLPLDIALPIFRWDIVFRGKEFRRIAKTAENLDEGETIRHEQVPFEELSRTQDILNKYLGLEPHRHSTILYHLDTTNISNYSHEEIRNIYSR